MDRQSGSFIQTEDGISPNLNDEAMKKRTEAKKTEQEKTKEVKKDVKK